ncbi:MAG: nucleotidyltransferase domain-containing protein [Alphaproteobacteria bacterium]|nr:nucleotidyltransferase domain-containing protein [Alphaproteobacteria bacterium]
MLSTLPYQFIERLKELPSVEAVYLFGSRARGDHRERSDIDIAVKMKSDKREDWLKVVDIIDEADTLLEIDCVDLNHAEEKFRMRILKEGKVL